VFTGPPYDIGFQENLGSAAPVQRLLGGFARCPSRNTDLYKEKQQKTGWEEQPKLGPVATEKRPVMNCFNQIRAAVSMMQDPTCPHIYLDFPTAMEPHLGNSAPRTKVNAVNVLPIADTEIRRRNEALEKFIQRNLRNLPRTSVLSRLNPAPVFLGLQQQPLPNNTNAGRAIMMLAQ
jgi:hypothetical protein